MTARARRAAPIVAKAVAAVVAGAPAIAGAQVTAWDLCDDGVIDPVAVPLRDGGWDGARSACLRADVDVRVTGQVLVDTPDFYGAAGGELGVGLRLVERFGLEWGARLRVVDVQFAQTAVIAETEASYGPVALHAAYGHRASRDVRLAGLIVAELPFTRSQLDVSSGGGQLAGLVTWGITDQVVLHGRGAVLGWYASSAGGTSARGAFVASADAAVRLLPWLVVGGGAEAQVGWYGPGVDHVAVRAGAHWRVVGPWRIEVSATAPVLGEERTDVAAVLGVRRDR